MDVRGRGPSLLGAWALELATVHFHSPSSGGVEEWARWNTPCALCLGGRKRKKKKLLGTAEKKTHISLPCKQEQGKAFLLMAILSPSLSS